MSGEAIRRHSYVSKPDGTWEITDEVVPFPTDPHSQRVKALAEAQPGRIAIGAKMEKSGEVKHEIEQYLDEAK